MNPGKCRIEILTTQVNIYLGPYHIFDPDRYLQSLTLADIISMCDLILNGKLKELREILDRDIEEGKDRDKRYIILNCSCRDLPKLRTAGKSQDEVHCELLKHVSKTALIKWAKSIEAVKKSRVRYLYRRVLRDEEENKDIYGLNEYFTKFWIPEFLSGGTRYINHNRKTRMHGRPLLKKYISLYISRKQNWI